MGNQFKDLQTLYGETELINPKVDGAKKFLKGQYKEPSQALFYLLVLARYLHVAVCYWVQETTEDNNLVVLTKDNNL